ncbi:hypothetical protein COX84_07035 [Candidatus Micrarchaeota archaeon CG_4_10_14_0_2_um_filter_49_7]|nr:MAG: hypothetical protein AUJ13_03010 [Candidatus Micrarchaeota archaeon CG1_02_49_24]PIZ92290.1 MAG: hypothetical protein COX84_07035 [Candidatus Micrarchaeota archaeon CG_4_10_14_0_2_um_filter_49_7]
MDKPAPKAAAPSLLTALGGMPGECYYGIYRELAEPNAALLHAALLSQLAQFAYRPLRGRMNAKPPIHENFPNEPHADVRLANIAHHSLPEAANPCTQRFALGSEHQRGRLFVKSD